MPKEGASITSSETKNGRGGVVVLGKYVDALYVSVKGRPKDGLLEALNATREALLRFGDGEAGDFVVPGLPGGPLRLLPGGRARYEFVLKNEAVYAELTSWANLPALLIQPMAYVFYQHNLREPEAMVDGIAGFFLESGFKVLVSSFHLAVDFQGEGFELPDAKDVVTRARKRKVEGDGPEPNTMTFGRRNGALQVQIYDKTEELKKSGKSWMHDVWREGDRYTEGLAVWRIEYRFSRKKLRELGINAIADLRLGVGDLVRAAVGEGRAGPWIRVASPDTRGYGQDRRPAAPWWEDIKAASLDGMPADGLLNELPQREPDLGHTETMLLAYLEKWMVLGGGRGPPSLGDPRGGIHGPAGPPVLRTPRLQGYLSPGGHRRQEGEDGTRGAQSECPMSDQPYTNPLYYGG